MCIITYFHIYIFTYIHVYMYTCIHICIQTCRHIYIYTFLHVYIYTQTHVYTYTYLHIYTCIYTCIHKYIQTYPHVYIYIYTPFGLTNIDAQNPPLKYCISFWEQENSGFPRIYVTLPQGNHSCWGCIPTYEFFMFLHLHCITKQPVVWVPIPILRVRWCTKPTFSWLRCQFFVVEPYVSWLKYRGFLIWGYPHTGGL